MEKVAIILRKSQIENKFRDVILGAFKQDKFNTIHICSGFFQERGKYFASNCFIAESPKISCKRKVIVVGVYNGIWKGDFDSFVTGLRKIKCLCHGTPLHVIKRKIRRYHWHAKVFIASDSKGPQLAVIGSSNITSRAFGLTKLWNFEADVILWNDSNKTAKKIMAGVFDNTNEDNIDGVIVSNYSSEDEINHGLSLQDRMKRLIKEIEEVSDVIE